MTHSRSPRLKAQGSRLKAQGSKFKYGIDCYAIAMMGWPVDPCRGTLWRGFDDINDVMSEAERTAFMAQYKIVASFAMKTVNNAASLIEKGARLMPA